MGLRRSKCLPGGPFHICEKLWTLPHRSLLACAHERLHEEIGADYNDMIYAATPEEIEARRTAFIRKWRLKRSNRVKPYQSAN